MTPTMKTALALIVVITAASCAESSLQQPPQSIEVVTSDGASCSNETDYPTGKKGHGCMGRPYGAGS